MARPVGRTDERFFFGSTAVSLARATGAEVSGALREATEFSRVHQ